MTDSATQGEPPKTTVSGVFTRINAVIQRHPNTVSISFQLLTAICAVMAAGFAAMTRHSADKEIAQYQKALKDQATEHQGAIRNMEDACYRRLNETLDELCGKERPLTVNEKNFLRSVFGKNIALTDIRIRYTANENNGGSFIGTVPNTLNISMASHSDFDFDFSDLTKGDNEYRIALAHEYVHWLQHQGQLSFNGHADYNDPDKYDFHDDLLESKNLRALNNEQQAAAIGYYIALALDSRLLKASVKSCAKITEQIQEEDIYARIKTSRTYEYSMGLLAYTVRAALSGVSLRNEFLDGTECLYRATLTPPKPVSNVKVTYSHVR